VLQCVAPGLFVDVKVGGDGCCRGAPEEGFVGGIAGRRGVVERDKAGCREVQRPYHAAELRREGREEMKTGRARHTALGHAGIPYTESLGRPSL
jgi:hypothetical protein